MSDFKLELEFAFKGQNADHASLDFYDASVALAGFQRTLAITTHLVLHDTVIVQAPALKGAYINLTPPEEGSWKVLVVIGGIMSGIITAGSQPRDTPVGHLMHSAYEFIIGRTLGFKLDYNESLGEQYDRLKSSESALPILNEGRFESAMEKCETSIKNMHRPIVASKSAESATIADRQNPDNRYNFVLNRSTADRVDAELLGEEEEFEGVISSYNSNTHYGRIYIPDMHRTIPFEVARDIRGDAVSAMLAQSLAKGIPDPFGEKSGVVLTAQKIETGSGRIRRLVVNLVEEYVD